MTRRLILFLTGLMLIFQVSCTTFPLPFNKQTPEISQTSVGFGTPISPSYATPTPAYTFPSCEPHPSAYTPSQIPLFTPSTPTNPTQPSKDTLRSLAEKKGMYVGISVSPNRVKNPTYVELITREFNTVVPENSMKWEIIHPKPEVYDFTDADTIISFAQSHDLAVRGHVLVWDQQLPPWIREAEHTRQEWMNILCTHIKTIVTRYRGRIYAWDVVNEAFNNEGILEKKFWLQKIGPDYIAMAFQWANEADPQALLFYNDFQAEGLNPKSQAIYAMASGLRKMGFPIHGIGMQMHTWLWGAPPPDDMLENMRRLADLGLFVHITEMDIRIQYSKRTNAVKMVEQADMYRQYMEVCLLAVNCNTFITWGLSDRHSWIPHFTGKPDAPLLFDENLQPKPAYYAVLEALKNP